MENGATARKESFISLVRGLSANFWYANFMEILERLAFFGVRAIAALYLVKGADENGLGLSQTDKGTIFAVWALLQCLIPMISGGYTDRYGFRPSLAIAFILNIIGYLLMAQSANISGYVIEQGWLDSGFWVYMVAACFVATGTAIFKPACHGTIAKTTDEKTSSMGWGIFYWVVNIGGAVAPMGAAALRGDQMNWNLVFYGAAIVTACNFLPAFLLYKEPVKEPSKEGEHERGPFGVFASSIMQMFKDWRLVVFLLIFSCFWLMFMQLWDLLPNFVDEWVDTRDVATFFGPIGQYFGGWLEEDGRVKPEIIINIDAWSIILLVLVISWIIRKISKVAAMVIGMIIALVGFVGAGYTTVGWLCCLMIFIFAIGEMTCSPTFSAYIGLIAPKDKKALYMGYSNIPFAIGWFAGNLVGAGMYDAMADKHKLARDYLVTELHTSAEFVNDQDLLPNTQVMPTMAFLLDGNDPQATVAAIRAALRAEGIFGETGGSEETGAAPAAAVPPDNHKQRVKDAYESVLGKPDPDGTKEATTILWDMHDPYMVWVYLGIFGLAGTVGMIIFYFTTRKSIGKNNNGQTAAA